MKKFSDGELSQVIKNVNDDNNSFITYIDKKQVLNKLTEEVLELSKKISDIKNKISDVNEERKINERRIKEYSAINSEYKYKLKIYMIAALTISVIIPSVSVGASIGILNTLKIIAAILGITEIVGLISVKLFFERLKNKHRIKYFNNKNITFEEMREDVNEKDKELNEKINKLELMKHGITMIKNNKKEKIRKLESETNNYNKIEEDQIKYEDDSIKKESVKKKTK